MQMLTPLKVISTLTFTLLLSSTVQANDNSLHPFFLNGGPAKNPAVQSGQQQSGNAPGTNTQAVVSQPASAVQAGSQAQYITGHDGAFSQVDRPDEHYRKHIINTEEGRVETKGSNAQPYSPKLDEGKNLNSLAIDLFDFNGRPQPVQPAAAASQTAGDTAAPASQGQIAQQQPAPVEKESAIPQGPRRDQPGILHPINLF